MKKQSLKKKNILIVAVPFLVAMVLIFVPADANAYCINDFNVGQAVLASGDGTTSVECLEGGDQSGPDVEVLIKSNLPEDEKIAKVQVDFSGGDPNWGSVVDSDLECSWLDHKSVINISAFSNIVSDTFTLYVPKDATASVRICEGAQDISKVYEGCFDSGENPNVTAEYICDSINGCPPPHDGVGVSTPYNYWELEGVSGTGGEAFGEEDGEAVPEFTTITFIIAAVAGFGIYFLIRRKNSKKEVSKKE